MNPRQSRADALRSLSAVGAGVLLAVTPHCGGQSDGTSDESDETGGSDNDRGGASGSAGTYDGPGMYGGGGYGGVGSGGYGGVIGVTGGYAGMGIGGTYGGSSGGVSGSTGRCLEFYSVGQCYTPAELVNCSPFDGGVAGSAGVDVGGAGGVGEGGAAGEFTCPIQLPFPGCVMSALPPPPDAESNMLLGRVGDECCYSFILCGIRG